MSQSKKQSWNETCTDTAIGFVGSWLISYICISNIANIELAATVATIGCTIWSLVRKYSIRRIFNRMEQTK